MKHILNRVKGAMVNRIVTHPGGAHSDDVMSVALLLGAFTSCDTVERRNPTQEDLDDPYCAVVDCGRVLDPDMNNFDHHH